MAQLQINVLGTFETSLGPGAEPIPLHSRKLHGLLAYLALCPGQGQPREVLATLLWGRSAQEQARASLRQALAVLRKLAGIAGVEVLVADHDRIALAREGVRVDAVEFQRLVAEGSPSALQQAAALYRGRFLEGLSVESEAFEDWVRGEGQRLQDLALRALSKLLAHRRETGAVDAAIETAHRILAIDPLYEEAHRALVGLHAGQGAHSQALQLYDRYRKLLQRELGIEPDAETKQLARRVYIELRASDTAVPGPLIQPPDATPGLPPAGKPEGNGLPSMDAPAAARGTPAYRAERRFVTLLSCRLVDAAAWSTRLDPEDLRDVLSAFMARCEEIVTRHGGHVARRMDHVLTGCFGYPRTDEHGPELSVRTALEILATIGQTTSLPGFRARVAIGIASGQVVVSQGASGGAIGELTIAGETPHVAAGLQAAAPADGVLVGESTRSLLGDLFGYEDMGRAMLEGFAAPVRVWRVLGEHPGLSRFAATRAAARLTPLTGRDEDLDLLMRRWRQAKAGAGQVVVLVGEPGIGKSRLVDALGRRLTREPHFHLAYYCSPHHQGSALYPVIQQLEHAAGYSRADPPAVKLDKLEALLAQGGDHPPGGAALIADLLSVPTEGRYPPLDLTPQRQHEKTLEILAAQLVGLTKQRPALMVFEDLHWSDASTHDFCDRLVELVQGLPVLLLITQRPGVPVVRSGEAHVTALAIRRLPASESEALVAGLAGEGGLPHDVLAQIVEKGDGVPLFLEELTKNALEAGELAKRPLHHAQRPLSAPAMGIPDTLYDLLLERLDRLGPAKATAQEAAVIGRHFSHKLLAAISTLDEAHLQAAMATLGESELVHVRGAAAEASYSFKHALIQEAAYASLLHSDRAPLHGRIAAALEAQFPETAQAQPEVLAFHFAEAGLSDKAVVYWQRAGELAVHRSAQRQAIVHFDHALLALETRPSSAERHGQELALRLQLAQTWMLAAGYAAPEVEAAYSRARDLCEALGDSHHLFFVLLGLWQLHLAKAEVARAFDTAQGLLPLARSLHNRDFEIEAHVAHVVTLHAEGNFDQALSHASQAVALHDPETRKAHIQSFGYDGSVIARTGAAWAEWMLGHPDRALRRGEETIALARALSHPYSLAMATCYIAWLHLFRREPREARELAEESIALSVEHGFPWLGASAAPVAGWAQAELGQMAVGIETIRHGLAALDQMGHRLWRPHQQGLLATAYGKAGRTDEALNALEQALAGVERTGERENAAELHRLKGELTLKRALPGAEAEGERCFLRAIEIAQRQSAKSWELRATMSLARLQRDQGRHRQAREGLAPIVGWFTEGLDTPDLKQAKALFDQLACVSGR